MKKHNRKEQRRYTTACNSIDEAFKASSKITAIRIDLGYKAGKSSAERMHNDLEKMRLNSRTNKIFKNQLSCVTKLEKSSNDGFHAHLLMLFNGHKIKNHKAKAKQLGEYWVDNITKGDGTYHNCNTKKYDNYALGVIERKDENAINALKQNVALYLCKDEQSIKSADGSDKKIKEFRCGTRKK